MSRLFTTKTYHDYRTGSDREYQAHNPKVDYVCWCTKCRDGYGTRNQYGTDEYCPKCGAWLDWSKEEVW